MEINDSTSVVLTGYHSYTPPRTMAEENLLTSIRKSNSKRINRMLSNESLHSPVFNRSISETSMDNSSMEDFWCELKNIKENSEDVLDDSLVMDVKPVNEGELEAEWLQEAGLSTLISGTQEHDGQALLSTLTRTQAAAVRKRYNTYTQTMRIKNKHSVRDVRDIFGINESTPTFEPLPVSPLPSNGVQIPVKKPIWKPVTSNNCALEKVSPSVAEELSFEVSFSETIVIDDKEKEKQKKQRIKKDDCILPKFIVWKSRFGLTEIEDLSLEDMKKIRYLSLIELTAFFDALGIELKRNRVMRVKGRENGLFGVPLTTLLENDQKKMPGTKVPLFVQKLLQRLEETGLDTEGILRVPGSVSRVKSLRQELETKFYDNNFDWKKVRSNDAAGLLKMFIRDLPTPLFTMEYIPAFIALVEKISKIKLQLQALHLLIMLLPDANRDTAKALLHFLKKVVSNEEKNKMSLWNVSMILAPNLFVYKGKGANKEEMKSAASTAHIVRLLIRYQDILWTVPSFLISQVRKMNEAALNNNKKQLIFDKSVRKLLRRKTMERERPERREHCDVPEGVIRVYAPLHSKVSMAIQLNSRTKAKDILARFQCENSHGTSEKSQIQSLYEIGGNIGEHCLDPDTYMLDVYHVNPHAEWILRPKTS
ncbi:rho GTPase-activating protein 28 isoform X1 [Rana temporaria]|uniref:rho GTPase-activating protein 28 isoform X1 n=2 Tax=Rana temporaria TaxID=8407 RepID=UPI001AAD341E|nr:rho GTPase-activating protein 28 isoform X1 [Rana temporaria]